MKSIPTISIIVPVFKTEKYIRQCVDSIIEQTYTDFELILVDDGSPDGCPIICEEYAKRDARVKVIHKKNEGVSAARNDGVQAAEGKYVAFVDSDDLMPGDALEKLAQHIENEEYDAIFGNHVLDYDGKRLPKKPRIASGKYSYLELRNRIIDDGTMTGFLFGSVWAGIYKRDILIRNGIVFNNNVRVNEDGLFNFEFICCCANVRVIEEYVYIYRQWKAAVKTPVLEKDRRFKDCEIALNEYIENRNEDFSTQLKRRRISIALELFLRDVLTNNEVDVVMLPCYYDWHEEHFRVMYSFARAAKKVEYKGDVGMYQVSLPIPARLINHGFKMNRQQLKEKWNCLRELYPSQNYLPTQRFILNEHINGKLAKAYALEAYAVQSFERWNNSLERNSLSDNEKAFLRKNLQRIAVVREFASNRYLQN